MKRIALLGSTGSIGRHTLDVVRRFPEHFCIEGLSSYANIRLLKLQAREFKPAYICVRNGQAPTDLEDYCAQNKIKLIIGEQGLRELVALPQVDVVVMAISGAAALAPLCAAVAAGKRIALANKEALVMAGSLIARLALAQGALLMPVDSEQSAIWQCLHGQQKAALSRILLTASGGPLRCMSTTALRYITVEQVLKHPRLKMGKKITVDSATLMNKGLEVIEAMFLFGVPVHAIDVVVHPEAIIHSMVEFMDGVVMGQMSATDMRIPIQYALSYPQRLPSPLPKLDFYKLNSLTFERPDSKRFPCLSLAYEAAKALGTLPCVMNAANEVCVEHFLANELVFAKIPFVVEKVMRTHSVITQPSLGEIVFADAWARLEANRIIHT